MRLYKKAAVCLLAAAMAVSMMTACGGGAGGNGGNGGSTGDDTEIVEPVPGPDTTDPDQGGETGGTTTEPTKEKITDVTKSQYAQSTSKIFQSNEFYVLATMAEYDANKTKKSETQETLAHKGDATYVKAVVTENGKTKEESILEEKTKDGNYADYVLLESDKVALKSTRNTPYMNFSNITKLPNEMYRTTVKVGGKEYYAETYTSDDGAENIVCFAENGMPKYQFAQNQDGSSETIVYQSIQLGTSKNLCQLSGYTVYTMVRDTEGNSILVDESGNKYKVTVKVDQNTYEYTGIEVKDSNGNDVTKKFAWLDTYFKAMF